MHEEKDEGVKCAYMGRGCAYMEGWSVHAWEREDVCIRKGLSSRACGEGVCIQKAWSVHVRGEGG